MDNEFWGMEQAYYKAQRKELDDLRKENSELKAKIASGVRVYAEEVLAGSNGIWSGYEAHTMFPVEQSNATLLLDKGEL